MSKKIEQLGMNPGTASHRLVKDLLWDFIVDSYLSFCFHCGESMSRDNFSIEHKEPWLDSSDPVKLYFDLNNIAYSHRVCNSKAGRKPNQKYFTKEDRLKANARMCREAWNKLPKEKQQTIRRDKYLRNGK